MNEPHADLFIRTARAVDAHFTAMSYVESADASNDLPEHAARDCWDAASVLDAVSEKFGQLAAQQRFQAKRMERAAREEARTGVEHHVGEHEHRLGPAA